MTPVIYRVLQLLNSVFHLRAGQYIRSIKGLYFWVCYGETESRNIIYYQLLLVCNIHTLISANIPHKPCVTCEICCVTTIGNSGFHRKIESGFICLYNKYSLIIDCCKFSPRTNCTFYADRRLICEDCKEK